MKIDIDIKNAADDCGRGIPCVLAWLYEESEKDMAK